MKRPITAERSIFGSWHVTYRGYTATSRATFLGALYGAWYYRRLDHPGRKIKWGEIPGRNGQHGLQIQWAPRRWVLFYRLGGGRIRAVWTRGAAPLDLAAADDMRFERFAAASRDLFAAASRDLFDDPASTTYRLRPDPPAPPPWHEFDLPTDPGDDPAAP